MLLYLLLSCLLAVPQIIAYECPQQGGTFPNPADCGSFYQCSNWSAALQQCPAGLLFDPQLLVCNVPNAVNCNHVDSFKCPQQSGSFPNPADCGSFYQCSNWDAVLQNCPEGLLFDPKFLICNVPSAVDCTGSQPTTTKTTPAPTTEYSTTTLKPTQPTNAPTTVTPTKPTDGPTPTTKPPNTGVSCSPTGTELKPNPNSCTSFFLCEEGKMYEITCPANTEFSSIAGKCVEEGSDCQGTDVPYKPDCVDQPSGTGLPHIYDCTKYFICSHGLAVENTCPPGLEYNVSVHVCDTPERANCVEQVKPTLF